MGILELAFAVALGIVLAVLFLAAWREIFALALGLAGVLLAVVGLLVFLFVGLALEQWLGFELAAGFLITICVVAATARRLYVRGLNASIKQLGASTRNRMRSRWAQALAAYSALSVLLVGGARALEFLDTEGLFVAITLAAMVPAVVVVVQDVRAGMFRRHP